MYVFIPSLIVVHAKTESCVVSNTIIHYTNLTCVLDTHELVIIQQLIIYHTTLRMCYININYVVFHT